jgi:hypothetical protein
MFETLKHSANIIRPKQSPSTVTHVDGQLTHSIIDIASEVTTRLPSSSMGFGRTGLSGGLWTSISAAAPVAATFSACCAMPQRPTVASTMAPCTADAGFRRGAQASTGRAATIESWGCGKAGCGFASSQPRKKDSGQASKTCSQAWNRVCVIPITKKSRNHPVMSDGDAGR